MIRVTCLFIGVLLCSGKLFSQDLEGEWKGVFWDNVGHKTTIQFSFKKLNDSAFEAYSKTFVKNGRKKDTSVCLLQGGFSKDNNLYLTEVRAIKPFSQHDEEFCLQMMKLEYYKRKRNMLLTGNWYTENNKCGNGPVRLTKNND